MRCALLLVLLASATALIAAEKDPQLAQVIDGESDRVPVHTVAPEYPHKARRDRIEGEVMVCFDVDRQGRPRRIAVRRSTNRQFEKPSIRAVRASAFKPLKDGEPLQTLKVCRTFIFALVPVVDDDS